MLIESAGGKEYVDIMVFGDMKEIGEEIGGDQVSMSGKCIAVKYYSKC